MSTTTTPMHEERTWKIIINSPKDKPWSVTIFRECIDDTGICTKRQIHLLYDDISSEVFDTVEGIPYTVSDVSAKIADYCDLKS